MLFHMLFSSAGKQALLSPQLCSSTIRPSCKMYCLRSRQISTQISVADAFSAGVSEDAIVDALTEETLESSFVATVTEGTGLVFVVNNVIVWLLGADLTSMTGNISLWCYS